jgi:hypothetical protein
MKDARTRRIAVRAVSAGTAVAGGLLGYDIGDRISGALLGVVMAANMAAIGALLAGALAERLFAARNNEAEDGEGGGR